MAAPAGEVHVLGVRHHGPGSARAVRAALGRIEPDAVLIEGPPEGDALTGLVGELEPPVALLAYRPDAPSRSAFWPMASFSPEWQALRHACDHGVHVAFCDLPAAQRLAAPDDDAEGRPDAGQADGDPGDAEWARRDPLGVLAQAAGYDDAERWWEDVVEQREDTQPSPFPAIAEAMAAVRTEFGDAPGTGRAATGDARREAHMRQVLRATLRDGYRRVAVVCGAWHAPALRDLDDYAPGEDAALLRNQPTAKVAATWVPWTHGRLATASGYGAGVRSPGWYHHLFESPDRPVARWLAEGARILREEEDQPTSSAHVIEAVRLAETLGALRGRPAPGLAEVAEATTAVLCEGAELRAELVHRRMVLGERLGWVPPTTPMVPLQQDLAARQKRLRFKPEATEATKELDLRKPTDRERSLLLHRLLMLNVRWGKPTRDRTGSRGTFRETWSLQWQPELDVALIEASQWGTTVLGAATARATAQAGAAEELEHITRLTERCLLAELTDALPTVLARLRERAAHATDVTHLMAALEPLARSARYGNVRGTDTDALATVAEELLLRACAGLPAAVVQLDAEAARAMMALVDRTQAAARLLDPAVGERWLDALAQAADNPATAGLIAGRAHRILRDAERIDAEELRTRFSRSLSRGTAPDRAADFLEGFLSGAGQILIHDTDLLRLVDTWLAGLEPEAFTAVLPLLRRTFGAFHAPERRGIGQAARRLHTRTAQRDGSAADTESIDTERAAPALAAVAAILAAGTGPQEANAEGSAES